MRMNDPGGEVRRGAEGANHKRLFGRRLGNVGTKSLTRV